jgi:DNA-binding CsgD family transcriptional regulator
LRSSINNRTMTLMTDTATPFPSDSDSDRAAIKAVLRAETAAFQAKNFEAWQSYWVHDERTTDIMASTIAGVSVLRGWPAVAEHMRQVLGSNLQFQLLEFGQENMQIEVTGHLACVIFDSWCLTGDGTKHISMDVRIMQKVEGAWKILLSSFVLQDIEPFDGKTIALDGVGRIVRANPEALELLKVHPTVSRTSGHLRARRRTWDTALQRAIRQAARHHGFFQTHNLANVMGVPTRYPVILGPTDDGGVAVVHFTIRDNQTFVHLDPDDVIARRLVAAKAVFGLSPGQLRVAQKIASGQGLKTLAQDLGISVNTARTHLSRLYDKTGVSSQPALVRLLLSIG